MADLPQIPWKFLSYGQTELEEVPPGKIHHWYTRPNTEQTEAVVLVRAQLAPGSGHAFHYHPEMDEMLYILSGEAEQWYEKERRVLRPGDVVCIPRGIIHGTYNAGTEELDFLAILTPAKVSGPMSVEVAEEEPWSSLRA